MSIFNRSQEQASHSWPAQPDEDARILYAARGDLAHFAPLYERYATRIYAYCLRRVRNREEAEDLTSLIFSRVLTGLNDYRGGSVAAWLFRIAHNTVVTHFRTSRAQVSLEALEGDFEVGEDDLIEGVMQQETQQRLRQCLAALTEEQQELVVLKFTGGLTAEEIGLVLGKSAGAVRVEFHRIVKQLRVLLRQNNEERSVQ